MPNWLVQLTGEKFDLEDLPNCFTVPELKVVEEFDSYYLKSELFDLLQDVNEVRVLAEELRDRMIGAAKLARSNFQPVDLGAVIRQEEDGKRNVYLFPETLVIRSKLSAKATVRGSRIVPQVPQPALWVVLAATDDKVAQALRLWGRGSDDWVKLFKLLEIIESDVGGAIYSNEWATKAEVSQFTQTANSAEALGDAARHAKKRVPAPSEPMPIEVARQLLKRLLERWITSKTSQLSNE